MSDTCFGRFVIDTRLALSRDELNSSSQIRMSFRKPLFLPEVTFLDTVIAHWEPLASIMQEAWLGGHHDPFHQGDMRGSECFPRQII